MLKLFSALMPKEERFFDMFNRHGQTLVAGAESLRAMMEPGADVQEQCRKVAQHEHEADLVAAEVMTAVHRTFITPFDRIDIQELTSSLDDAIDQMHKTSKAVTLYDVTKFEPAMLEMADTVVQAAKLTLEALPLLNKMGPNVGRLNALTAEIVRVEEKSDELFDKGMKALFQTYGETSPMKFIVGAEIYDHLEKVVDRFEDVANRISGIVIEHM
ncbi:DUF47 domain-containing protein [Caulobacter sp. 17J65-9]|uniref:DUF47 domain-containing protein n=1 Tax=Caulobacter sp. 17J65-9 TaxID=2709382 RepID=UPI0013C84436|nr:DUF47 domain-containing protein [Caulobacter sp. 17J65-9]NEX92805.1 DUF47 domain-containing protein [Caulobacter sp. 17J65-9]